MTWQFRPDLPIYSQLIEQITQAIVTGEFSPGEKLLSVRELAASAGVNPNTMQRALSELEQGGLLYTQRTAGRFVTSDTEIIARSKQKLAEKKMEEFLSSMRSLGFDRQEILQALNDYLPEEVL
jgi:DNA-binding transcriptional regulator YhcF (GntR family)